MFVRGCALIMLLAVVGLNASSRTDQGGNWLDAPVSQRSAFATVTIDADEFDEELAAADQQ
jgi:hypothetical protein